MVSITHAPPRCFAKGVDLDAIEDAFDPVKFKERRKTLLDQARPSTASAAPDGYQRPRYGDTRALTHTRSPVAERSV